MGVKIEKNVPLPPKAKPSGNAKYPWTEMEIGDSFFCVAKRRSFIEQASRAGKIHGLKFTVRSVEENGVKGVRVWRIE